MVFFSHSHNTHNTHIEHTLIFLKTHTYLSQNICKPVYLIIIYIKLRSRLLKHEYLREVCSDYEQEHRLLLESEWFPHSAASSWLQALPNKGLGQYMTNTELHSVLTLRLHIPFFPRDKTCEKCGSISDQWGFHALGCKGSENLNKARHEDVVEAVC